MSQAALKAFTKYSFKKVTVRDRRAIPLFLQVCGCFRLLCFVWTSPSFSLPDLLYPEQYQDPKMKFRTFCIILFCSQRSETTLCCFPRDDSPIIFHSNSSHFRASAISLQVVSLPPFSGKLFDDAFILAIFNSDTFLYVFPPCFSHCWATGYCVL